MNPNDCDKKNPIPKKKYEKPVIETEEMILFGQGGSGGGSCNGTSNGGRKSTTAAPENCNASKLKT